MSHWLLHYSFFKCNNSNRSNSNIKWDIHRIFTHLLRHPPPTPPHLPIKFTRKILFLIIIITTIIIIIVSLINNCSSSSSNHIINHYRSSSRSHSSQECITIRAFLKDKNKISKSINRQKTILCIISSIISSRNFKSNRINRYENIFTCHYQYNNNIIYRASSNFIQINNILMDQYQFELINNILNQFHLSLIIYLLEI